MSRTTRIDPNAVLGGYLKWELEAIIVCNLYYRRRPDVRIVCASSIGVAYLLANPSMIRYGRSSDAILWAEAIFGKEYYQGHMQAFSSDIPLESLRGISHEGRELEGYIDGLECRRLVEFNKIKVIGKMEGFPPCTPKPFDPATDSVFVHSDIPSLYRYRNDSSRPQTISPVQVEQSAADTRGE